MRNSHFELFSTQPETDVNGAAECVEGDEFCMTDTDTGELIRLTVEEKERIFMDSLQVSDDYSEQYPSTCKRTLI